MKNYEEYSELLQFNKALEIYIPDLDKFTKFKAKNNGKELNYEMNVFRRENSTNDKEA